MLSWDADLISWSTTHLKDRALWQKMARRLDLRSTEVLDQPLIAINIVGINWNFGRARMKHIRQLSLEQAFLYNKYFLSKVCNRKVVDKEATVERCFCKNRCFKNSCSGVHKISVKKLKWI